MIQNLQSAMEAEQDLHIAKHIEPEKLPAMIQPIMSLAQSDAERDMLLMSLLTAAGSCMPNLYFRLSHLQIVVLITQSVVYDIIF